MKPSLCCWLAVACGCFADEAPIIMGSDWFDRLREPKTRVEALYQLEKAGTVLGRGIQDFEEFSSGHRRVMVFPCPQPGQPDAWAIVNPAIWKESRANLCGREAEAYDPHPLEIERRGKWDEEQENHPADFKPWRPGDAWFESLSGELVDPSGRELGGFFASPGILADFNGDGMLDLLQIERLSSSKKEKVIDCATIGQLDSDKLHYGAVYANLRADFRAPRSWRFAVRGEPGGLRLVLVPEDKSKAEIAFAFQNGVLTASVDKLPDDVLLDARPKGDDSFFASSAFLESHGHDMTGSGSDFGCQVLADFPARSAKLAFKSLEIKLPQTGDADPREAARLLAGNVFNSAFYRSQYELASIGEPAKPATRGWLEYWCDGGGWGEETVDLWWLDGDKAERWIQKDSTTFLVSRHVATDLGRRIAVAHEIDRIRTVPIHPFPASADHELSGGDDFPAYRVRAATQSPVISTTVFEECSPPFWQWIGPEYDRKLSSLIAALHVSTEAEKTAEPRDIRALVPVWLDPERVSSVPPGLARAAVVSVGVNLWSEMKPLLEKLQASLGPLSEEEKRIAVIDKADRDWYELQGKLSDREKWLAQRKLNTMQREMRELTVKLTGDIRFELRRPIAEALEKLKESSDNSSR